jgi:hypothetical protein
MDLVAMAMQIWLQQSSKFPFWQCESDGIRWRVRSRREPVGDEAEETAGIPGTSLPRSVVTFRISPLNFDRLEKENAVALDRGTGTTNLQ